MANANNDSGYRVITFWNLAEFFRNDPLELAHQWADSCTMAMQNVLGRGPENQVGHLQSAFQDLYAGLLFADKWHLDFAPFSAFYQGPVSVFGRFEPSYHEAARQLTEGMLRSVKDCLYPDWELEEKDSPGFDTRAIEAENVPMVLASAKFSSPASRFYGWTEVSGSDMKWLQAALWQERDRAGLWLKQHSQNVAKDRAESGMAEDSANRANILRLFPRGPIDRQDIRELVVQLDELKGQYKNPIEIARQITKETKGASVKADRMLASARKLRNQGRIIY